MTHNPRNGLRRAVLALAAATALGAQAQTAPSQASVDAHVAAAKTAAGSDLGNLMGLCNAVPATRASGDAITKVVAQQLARPAPPPGKAFDNLAYVGGAWASAWALDTKDGILLIDALNNDAEAAQLIDGGLRQLGMDPARIKTVIVTHAHGDHYGGAQHLSTQYKPRWVMSEIDWRQTEGQLEFATPLWGAPPKRDVAVNDGDTVKLGDDIVTTLLTPGHTLGTITPIFEVRDKGQRHRAMVWGGTAFNFGRDMPRLDAYIDATRRLAQVARAQQIDVMLSNHPGYDGTVKKLEALRSGSGDNPFVIGTPAVLRALTVMGECALAQRDRFLLAP
jgi:metallo-beta-lactamase class B